MTKKEIKFLIEDHMDILDHFIEQGAYPIRVNSNQKKIAKICPWLCVDEKELLALDPSHEIPSELLAAYWKKRFEEEREENNKMYKAIQELNRTVG